MKRGMALTMVVFMWVMLAGVKCTSTGGEAGKILPDGGTVTKSEKRGLVSWRICVKAPTNPNDAFADGVEFCDVKESVERGEWCQPGEVWPTCYLETNRD